MLMRLHTSLARVAGILLLLASAHAPGAPAAPAAPKLAGFHSVYELRYSGLRADATVDLRAGDAPTEYVHSISTKTRGLARLIRPGTATEVAHFSYTAEGFTPHSYRLDDGAKSAENDSDILFDWQNGIARSVHENVAVELEIKPGMLDRLTADIAAIQLLRNGEPLTGFDLVDRNEIRDYDYLLQGNETVKVPAGTFETVKYLRTRPGSSRATLIWYAPDAKFLPVKIVQLKRGKPAIEMVATVLEPDAGAIDK